MRRYIRCGQTNHSSLISTRFFNRKNTYCYLGRWRCWKQKPISPNHNPWCSFRGNHPIFPAELPRSTVSADHSSQTSSRSSAPLPGATHGQPFSMLDLLEQLIGHFRYGLFHLLLPSLEKLVDLQFEQTCTEPTLFGFREFGLVSLGLDYVWIGGFSMRNS